MKHNTLHFKKGLSLLLALCFVISMLPFGAEKAFAVTNELDLALNVPGGTLSFMNDLDKPWVVDDVSTVGRVSAKTNIVGMSGAQTTLTLNAGYLQKNKVLHFEWDVSSEGGKDLLYFLVNDTPFKTLSGVTGDWAAVQYIVPANDLYTFKWMYRKDNAVNSGKDSAWVDNVKIVDFVPVDGVIVTSPEPSVDIQFTTQFYAEVVPLDATIQEVTWASDNTAVATVDSKGLVTGISQGTAYIAATPVDPLGTTGGDQVTVNAPIPTSGVSLNHTSGTLLVGETGTLVATLTPEHASYRNTTWSSSDNAIATVTTAGLVRGIAPGKVVIRALTQTGNFSAMCNITVVNESKLKDQTHLTYTPVNLGSTTPVTLGWNISHYIQYSRPPLFPVTTAKGFSVYLEEGTKVRFETGGSAITDTYLDLYDSDFNRLAFDDDEGRASYSLIEQFLVPQTGTYYLLVSGYGISSTGSFNLYVTEIPPILVTGVVFDQDTFTVPLNYTLPLPYCVLPLDADKQGVSFNSSNPGAITVNAAGEVTGVSSGSSLITVTTAQGGFTATILVSVGYTAVQGISFNTDAVIAGLNKIKALQYTIEPADAQLRGVSFVSNNTSVATVSAAGVVTAVGLGNAIIEVTTSDGGFKDTCSVKVVEVNISTCASVTLVAGDVWSDGTGYQLLLDADADAYGRLFQKSGGLNLSGNVPNSVYDQFEYKIPANANGVLTTSNIVVNDAVTILIPAGVYDYCIANPTPNDRVWIADTNVSSPGRYNNFNFEAGYSYTFVMTNSGIPYFKRDQTALTAAYTGAGLSKYAVNYAVSGSGGTLVGKTSLLAEEGYTLTADDLPIPTPDYGYHFTGWNADPVDTTVNAPISFICTFAINNYNVVFKDWDGTILKVQENVVHGTAATAASPPDSRPNWHFVGWSPDFSVVTENLTVTAQYAINGFAVNLPSGEGYTVLPEGSSSSPAQYGGNYSFTVELQPPYSDSTVVVKTNGTVLTPVRGVYTIKNIMTIHHVTLTGVVPNDAVYTALDAAIALSPDWVDSYYIPPTIDAFRGAVAAGLTIARNLNTFSQPMIDDATGAILAAYDGLVLKPADYMMLDTALALTPAHHDIYYTSSSIDVFRNAIALGQGISRSLNITQQSMVDQAAAAINSAFTGLALRPAQALLILNSESALVIDRSENSLVGICLKANAVIDVLSEFDNFAVMTITDIKGLALSADDLVGTGSVIRLLDKDGAVTDQVTVILYGDTDGDGLVDGRDATIAGLIASGMLTALDVGDYVYEAADVNRDGQINNDDIALLERAGLFLD
ncbi:MAG TPA: Ig-like domain-containing protein [Clostridia bacterium]|nr:Ig-like domain-containing protein [Clostridia bacterium]